MTATMHPKSNYEKNGAVDLASTPTGAVPAESASHRWFRYVAAATRVSLGSIFLWAFLDKTFALGHETGVSAKTGLTDYFGPAAWIHGGSPTKGFLAFGTKGPLADFYGNLAGNPIVDWLFMLGLLGIGTALILGIGMRIAAVTGAALLVMMFTASLPPANHIFMDDHIVYAMVLVLLALAGAGKTFGLGKRWETIPVVRDHDILK